LVPGVVCMVVVMITLIIALTPIVWGIPRPEVIKLVIPALLPFNLLKALVNSGLAFGLYQALKKAIGVK